MNKESKLQEQKLALLEQIVAKQALLEKPQSEELVEIKNEIAAIKQQIQEGLNKSDSEEISGKEEPVPYTPMIKHSLMLRQARYSLGSYIPSGSYVKGVLLSAVDASVGVNVSADPQPVLIRLLDDSHLPNNANTKMKRCHIMGAARGDLSSERVFIRLEKLSCVDVSTDSIVETDVHGYVTSEDGRNGLQGIIVDRSGRVISKAVLTGLIGTASTFLQTWIAARAGEITSGRSDPRNIQNNILPNNLGSNFSSQGVSGAFDKLAEYYIKRAEQLQPVVIINAGRVVNIVFSKGSKFGDDNNNQKPSAA